MGYRFLPMRHGGPSGTTCAGGYQPWFANARSVRNALERARLRHARRLVAEPGVVGLAELSTIEPADLLSSRVFDEPESEAPA